MAKEKKPTPAKGLLEALKFIKPAQKKTGTPEQTHCLLSNNWMVATNGILTIATPIEEDLCAWPHSFKLEEALKRVGEEMSITQLSQEAISVSSGNLKAVVPCLAEAMVVTGPDPVGGQAGEELKQALKDLAPIVTDGASEAYLASVLINGTEAVATNGHLILEINHGLYLPQNVLVPKSACVAVAKTKKKLTGFGFSGPSCTFWFEDGSFIKTQLFNEKYPNYHEHLNVGNGLDYINTPETLFEAVDSVKDFSKSGIVYLKGDSVYSDDFQTQCGFDGIDGEIGVNAKYLKMVKNHIGEVAIYENQIFFFEDDTVRGMIMGVEGAEEV